MPAPNETVELGSDYSCFVLADSEQTLSGLDVPRNTLVQSPGTDDAIVMISTGSQWGPFSVTVAPHETEPPTDDSWEDVVEFSVSAGGPIWVSDLIDREALAKVTLGAGDFRVRVSARGRTESRDRDLSFDDDMDFGERAALEHYLIESWPAAASESTVVRETSQVALQTLNPTAEAALLEEGPSLVGTRTIGRDLDGERELSGQLGAVRVEGVVPGTRRRLFRAFGNCTGWSGNHSYVGGGGLDLVSDGGKGWTMSDPGFDGELADGLTGSGGYLEDICIGRDSPAWIERTWNWFIGYPVTEGRPFLSEPSKLRMDFAQRNNTNGEPETTIRIEHSGLPVEWVAGMTAFWELQLAIARHREFGTR
jgi:hypothetical protein